MDKPGYTFIVARWAKERDLLSDIQQQLFVDEPFEISNEEADDAYHILVFDGGGRTVGSARMQPGGRVDYVGVLRPWRGNTVGTAVMTYLRHIGEATRLGSIWAMVPENLEPFFERSGFRATGETEMINHLLHRKMVRTIMGPGKRSELLH